MSRMRNWPVPFLRSLEGRYDVGQSVFLKGAVLGERFHINIQAGEKIDGSDIPLHISIRPDEKKFVVNSLAGGNWGKEERHSLNFKEGDEFDIRIRALEDKFQIYSQGKEVFTFDYRAPLVTCSHLNIDGAVELHHVSWEGRFYEMPYQSAISGLGAGKSVYVSGLIDKKANRFNINLKAGNDFALHVNPRFDEKVIVRNYSQGDKWGAEERDGEFNLKKDRTFDIIISCTASGYEIYVDGVPYCSFPQHIPVSKVDQITIEGDIELQGVHWDK